eukprot:g14453.t1
MMAYATNAVLGGRQLAKSSEAVGTWTTAHDSSGRMFWFNEFTHETTYIDPEEYGNPAFSPRPIPMGASPVATPFDGSMTPATGYYAGTNGYMFPPATVPPTNGFMSPPAMISPANDYMSPVGGTHMPPSGLNHHQRLHDQHHQPQNDYPLETRSPCPTGGGGRRATPYQSDYPQERRQQQTQGPGRGAFMAPFGDSSGMCSGYRWEECYKQIDGKKFWRHKETGVILTKDPYR